MVDEVTRQMDRYDLQKAVTPFIDFIDLLNNWYIRRSRRRFWRSENDLDKEQAYQTLYTVLCKLILVAAPFVPFITEEIYRNLRVDGSPESVHLCDYPVYDPNKRDEEMELKMKATRQAVSMGRAVRAQHSLKIRQPLKAIHLVTKDADEKRVLIEMQDIIKDELNVKEAIFRENEEELVTYRAQANYRKLGKILGKDMKSAAEKIAKLSSKEIQSIMEGGTLELNIGERGFDLTAEGVSIIREERENLRVLNEGSLTVALDSELTEELVQEGTVRDIVRYVQNLRKEKGLNVTDRIHLSIDGPEELKKAVEIFEHHLTSETLAVSWAWKREKDAVKVACGDETCYISLSKA
jgi:isoleucyl-tRNA synthetase